MCFCDGSTPVKIPVKIPVNINVNISVIVRAQAGIESRSPRSRVDLVTQDSGPYKEQDPTRNRILQSTLLYPFLV